MSSSLSGCVLLLPAFDGVPWAGQFHAASGSVRERVLFNPGWRFMNGGGGKTILRAEADGLRPAKLTLRTDAD